MSKTKIYILFSNPREETDYTIICVSTDVNKVLDECRKYNLDWYYEDEKGEPLTVELIEDKKYIDFQYIEGERYVLTTFETDFPSNREMYAVFANGYEKYFWEADLMGLFSSKETAVNTIISEVSKNYDEEEEIEGYRNKLIDSDSICDLDFTYWNIIKVKIV